ncbi:conserved unknown protein [Ectocarpus siliculosus]|uniref:Calpain catalytic domain-containing protein n=1 Tax=Ectocarpus siliculosus TaxID=2880 RepID=D7G3H8_ECTSI|nr:conserved unknown protein [Ectocarpus siliculosus]|eukprot:CBJ26976.1 conserved unknown protein [Ectocarpus siliculosus]
MAARVSTEAFCRAVVARVTVRDPKVGGTLKTSCSWELLEPSASPVPVGKASRENKSTASIRRQLRSAQSLGLAGTRDDGAERLATQRSEEIVKRCGIHGVLYIDLEFPPNDSSLGPSLAASGLVTWRRPIQFDCGSATAFGGYGRPLPSDVRPCPFAADASLACALAALAERPCLVSAALCGRVEEVVSSSCASRGCDGGGRRGGGTGGGTTDHDGKDFPSETAVANGRTDENRNGRGDHLALRKRTGVATAEAAAKAFMAATESGIFCARLCADGVWKEYVLDDFFPCLSSYPERGGGSDSGGGGPCLSRAHGPALWVSMLEKAYARVVGSYSAALGGCCLPCGPAKEREETEARAAASVVARPAKVLGVLTGSPVLQVDLSAGRRRAKDGEGVGVREDEDEEVAGELWGSIVSWARQGWLVCLSTPSAETPEGGVHQESGESWKDGLRLGYAYTVLQTASVGSGHRLVRLRGPLLPKEGWRGKWTDDSPLWTQEALIAAQNSCPTHPGMSSYRLEEPGAFWVSIEEAVSAFVEVGVCMVPLPPRTGGDCRGHERILGGSRWAHEVRRRVVFKRRRDRAGGGQGSGREYWGSGGGTAGIGAAQGKEEGGRGEEEEGGMLWGASQVYALSVYETSRIFFSVYQENRSDSASGVCWRDVGVTVLRVRDGCGPEVVASTGNPAQASVSTGTVLFPGRYVVIPSYTGCVTKDQALQGNSELGNKNNHPVGVDNNDPLGKDEAPHQDSNSGHPLRTAESNPRETSNEKTWREGAEAKKGREGEEDSKKEAEVGLSFDQPEILKGLMTMFEGLDADCDGVLCREELDAFLRTTEGIPLQDDVYVWLVRSFSSCPRPSVLKDTHVSGHAETPRRVGAKGRRRPQRQGRASRAPPAGIEDDGGCDGCHGGGGVHDVDLCLTRHGFVEMYRYIWQAAGRDFGVVMRDLRFAECHDARSEENRPSVVVAVHSDVQGFDFLAQPPDPELLEAAVALPIQRWGYPSPGYPDLASPPPVEHSRALATIASGSNKTGATTTAEMETATTASVTGHEITATFNNASRTDDDNENESNKARIIIDDAANNNNKSGLLLYVRPGPKGAENAVTFLVQSPIHFFSVRARLDCTGSVNASPMPGSIGLSREVTLLPGQSKVIQHLVPTDPRTPWSWKHAPLTVDTL